jgi:hypothetical protein
MSDTRMGGKHSSTKAVGRKLGHEMLELGLIFAYLYVCLGAIILYKWTILRGQGIDYAPYGLAAIKAFLLAKFILIGHAAKVGDRYRRRRFISVVAYKSLLFLLMLFVLSIIEEAIVAVIHGRPISAAVIDVGGGTLPETLASCLIMLLILIPYVAFRELSEVLGEGRLRQILLDYRTGTLRDSRSKRHESEPAP